MSDGGGETLAVQHRPRIDPPLPPDPAPASTRGRGLGGRLAGEREMLREDRPEEGPADALRRLEVERFRQDQKIRPETVADGVEAARDIRRVNSGVAALLDQLGAERLRL